MNLQSQFPNSHTTPTTNLDVVVATLTTNSVFATPVNPDPSPVIDVTVTAPNVEIPALIYQ